MFWLFLIVHAVNWWPRWLVYEPVGNFLRRRSHSGWTSKKSENFSQALASAFSHGAMAYLAWMILKYKNWLWNIQSWAGEFHHLPLHHHHVQHPDDHQPLTTATTEVSLVEPELKLYYLLYAARYFSDAVSLFYEHHRSVRQELCFCCGGLFLPGCHERHQEYG
jgi:hypothetical protein